MKSATCFGRTGCYRFFGFSEFSGRYLSYLLLASLTGMIAACTVTFSKPDSKAAVIEFKPYEKPPPPKPKVIQGLPDAIGAYKAWREVTKGPRLVERPDALRNYTLCAPALSPGADKGPHGEKFTRVYANSLAWQGLEGKLTKTGEDEWWLQPGSIVIKTKEVLGQDNKPALIGIGAMIKRASGYDSRGGDWEYLYAAIKHDKVTKLSSGKLASCRSCHMADPFSRDRLFMPYLND